MRCVAPLLLLAGGGAFFLAVQAFAQANHGQGHAENHDWYKELQMPNTGGSCCSDEDCRPTRAYVDDDGQWRALLDGRWVVVPWLAVLKQAPPDGRSHICASKSGTIYCFLPGSPKS